MISKSVILSSAGVLLIVLSIGLGAYGFISDKPSPAPALTSLGTCILCFVLGCYLISRGVRGFKNVESSGSLRALGNAIFIVGLIVLLYAAVAFFSRNDLPPNTEDSRLPSLYLLFAGIVLTLVGSGARNFRLHK